MAEKPGLDGLREFCRRAGVLACPDCGGRYLSYVGQKGDGDVWTCRICGCTFTDTPNGKAVK